MVSRVCLSGITAIHKPLNNMKKIQRENLKVRILKLADLQSTGTPSELAYRFDISERSIKRIVSEIRGEGKEIRFSSTRKSYVTGKEFI